MKTLPFELKIFEAQADTEQYKLKKAALTLSNGQLLYRVQQKYSSFGPLSPRRNLFKLFKLRKPADIMALVCYQIINMGHEP